MRTQQSTNSTSGSPFFFLFCMHASFDLYPSFGDFLCEQNLSERTELHSSALQPLQGEINV